MCNFHQLLQVLLHILCVSALSTSTFSRPFSCTFSKLICGGTVVSTVLQLHFAAIFVYISVDPRLPPSVDAQRCLYSTPTLIYSATASFSRPFSCTFLYTHAFLHLWTHSDASILHLHSSVDVQRSLQCYLRPVLYTFSYIHAYIHLWPHR